MDVKTEHVAGAADEGMTVLALVRRVADLPWSRAEALVQTRRVMVGGEVVTEVARRVRAGERLVVLGAAAAVTRGMLEPERIVYVDADIVVVRKPAGLMTVPFEKEDRDTLIGRTAVTLRRSGVSAGAGAGAGAGELLAVQRLDKETSGLLVFARGFQAKSALARQFDVHSVERRYLAIVHGVAVARRYENWLVKDRGDGIRGSHKGSVASVPRDAQRAVTNVTVQQILKGATLVECQLETGRTHQIRIHLAEAGTPIVGEPVYVRDYRGPRIEAARLMLHAAVLGFRHPRDARPVRFEEAPPEDFRALLQRLG